MGLFGVLTIQVLLAGLVSSDQLMGACVLSSTTRPRQRDPLPVEAMTRALMFADPRAASGLNSVARTMVTGRSCAGPPNTLSMHRP